MPWFRRWRGDASLGVVGWPGEQSVDWFRGALSAETFIGLNPSDNSPAIRPHRTGLLVGTERQCGCDSGADNPGILPRGLVATAGLRWWAALLRPTTGGSHATHQLTARTFA